MAVPLLKQISITDIQEQILELSRQISSLEKQTVNGTISSAGTAYYEVMQKERFKLIEELVLSVHTNAIQNGTITKNGKEKVYYQTRVRGLKTPPRCYSYEKLIIKLYEHYFDNAALTDYSFKAVFETALNEKIRTEAPKEKTIRDYNSSYKAFIEPSFGERDIRFITASELKEYIQITTRVHNLTKKRFYKFKGVLNLVFNYATNPEHMIISHNIMPVDNAIFRKNIHASVYKPEDKAFTNEDIKCIREYLWERVSKLRYDVNGYAILFSSHTGVRQGEIPSLKWSDVDLDDGLIHIHSQQNDEIRNGEKYYYYNPTTKNEKGEGKDGRYIPLTNEVRHILNELKSKQELLGIDSEWVFAKEDGDWITTVGYYESLYRLCTEKLHLNLSNNHAFRIALNSYVLIPMGLEAPERARILGHSVETNLKYYTFSREKEYLHEIGSMWDRFNDDNNSLAGVNRGQPLAIQKTNP